MKAVRRLMIASVMMVAAGSAMSGIAAGQGAAAPGGARGTAAAAPKISTIEDLRKIYSQGNYRLCLQGIAKLIGSGPEKMGFEKSDLLYLRGECLIAQGDPASALPAYQAAEKEGKTGPQKLLARSMVVMIKSGNGKGYRTSPTGEPMDIVKPESRKTAMAALFTQKFPAASEAATNSLGAKNLPPLTHALPAVLDVGALEYAATGATTRTLAIAAPMGDRARELIGTEIDRLGNQLTQLQSRSNFVVTNNAVQVSSPGGGVWWEGNERAGLSPDDRDWLRTTANYLNEIMNACKEGTQLATVYEGNLQAWQQLSQLCEKAGTLLNQISEQE